MLTRALKGAALRRPFHRLQRRLLSTNPFAAARKRGGRSGAAAGGDQSDQSEYQQRVEDVKKRPHDKNLTHRFNDLEDYLQEVLAEKTQEDRGFNPSQEEWNEMEAEAMTRWAAVNGYAATAVSEPEPEDGQEPVTPGEAAECGSAGEIVFEKAFDNFHDYEAMFDDVAEAEEDPKAFMFNAPDAESARPSSATLEFSADSRALLDDILEGASEDARRSIEQLVHSTYGPTAASHYLENMRTPRMPENCIAADHWAAPLLEQYLRVLDANPHYTPKQIETLLKQFGRELSTDYYKDEPFELDDGTVIDDIPKDDDEEDEDDGYLN